MVEDRMRPRMIISNNNGGPYMSTNEEIVEELDWLGTDGICNFPEDVKAVPLGFVSPGFPYAFYADATPEMLQAAIDKGWIKFVDGDGNKLTFKDYVAKYPGYPDPVFVLKLQGRFPPNLKKFIRIGRR